MAPRGAGQRVRAAFEITPSNNHQVTIINELRGDDGGWNVIRRTTISPRHVARLAADLASIAADIAERRNARSDESFAARRAEDAAPEEELEIMKLRTTR